MTRKLRVLVVALNLLIGLLACSCGFRTWIRESPQKDAPVVALSIGDDLLNDVGLHQASYQAVITGLGGRVLEFSPQGGLSPSQILDRVDAVVLTGGGDVDPTIYGLADGEAQLVDAERDEFEAQLVRGALARDMPILAVCRGHQIMNVALGGTVRDIRHDRDLARVHGITARSLVAHPVHLVPGSLVRACETTDRITVNSFHGQVVDAVAPGLVATALAPDGVVEAIEAPGARFALGMQWHPEMLALTDPGARRLFERLLREARRYHRQGAST